MHDRRTATGHDSESLPPTFCSIARWQRFLIKSGGQERIELSTSRTLSENHTPRPLALLIKCEKLRGQKSFWPRLALLSGTAQFLLNATPPFWLWCEEMSEWKRGYTCFSLLTLCSIGKNKSIGGFDTQTVLIRASTYNQSGSTKTRKNIFSFCSRTWSQETCSMWITW